MPIRAVAAAMAGVMAVAVETAETVANQDPVDAAVMIVVTLALDQVAVIDEILVPLVLARQTVDAKLSVLVSGRAIVVAIVIIVSSFCFLTLFYF